jgi:hypothetical protein
MPDERKYYGVQTAFPAEKSHSDAVFVRFCSVYFRSSGVCFREPAAISVFQFLIRHA